MENDNAPYQGKTMITELNHLGDVNEDHENEAAESDHEERSN